MRISDVMTTRVSTIAPDATAQDAFNLMRGQDIHHLVVMEKGAVAGVLSTTDLGGDNWDEVRGKRTIRELMTRQPVTVRPETPCSEAAELLRGRTIGCLPVMGADGLAGIVTIYDLLEFLDSV